MKFRITLLVWLVCCGAFAQGVKQQFGTTNTAPVLTNIIRSLGPFINVKTYGAAGNGVTDDYTSIQNAINYAGSIGGGIVYLPQAVYKVGSTLLLTNNCHLMGAGMGASVILNPASVVGKGPAGEELGCSVGAIAQTNITVSDLTIDHITLQTHCNGLEFAPANTTTKTDGGNKFYGTPCQNVTVERVEVRGFPIDQYLCWFWGVFGGRISGCFFNGNGTNGSLGPHCVEMGYVKNLIVEENRCNNADGAGIWFFGGSDVANVILANNCVTNCRYGIYANFVGSLDGTNQLVQGLSVHDNIVSGTLSISLGGNLVGAMVGRQFNYNNNLVIGGTDYSVAFNNHTSIMFDMNVNGNMVAHPFGAGPALVVAGVSNLFVSGNSLRPNAGNYTMRAGAQIFNCTNAEFRGNVVAGVYWNAFEAQHCRDIRVLDNSFTDDGSGFGDGLTLDQTALIYLSTNVSGAVVSGNKLRYGRSETYAVLVPTNSLNTNVQIALNNLMYLTNGSIKPFTNGSISGTSDLLYGPLTVKGVTTTAGLNMGGIAGGTITFPNGDTIDDSGNAHPAFSSNVRVFGTLLAGDGLTVTGVGTLSSGVISTTTVTATNSFMLPTNYVAANFVPVAGMVKICASNGVLWKVTQLTTNLLSANTP